MKELQAPCRRAATEINNFFLNACIWFITAGMEGAASGASPARQAEGKIDCGQGKSQYSSFMIIFPMRHGPSAQGALLPFPKLVSRCLPMRTYGETNPSGF